MFVCHLSFDWSVITGALTAGSARVTTRSRSGGECVQLYSQYFLCNAHHAAAFSPARLCVGRGRRDVAVARARPLNVCAVR